MFPLIDITPLTTLHAAAAAYLEQLKQELELGHPDANGASDIGNKRWCFRFFGTLGDKTLGSLTRSQIQLRVDRLATLTSTVHKRPLISLRYVWMRCFSALLSWCADRHDDLVNLPLLTRKRPMRYAVEPRRILTWSELQSLRSTLAEFAGDRATLTPRNMIRLLQVLCNDGARMCEIRKLTTKDVHLEKGAIVLNRGKSGRPRIIVLSRVSLTIIREQMDLYPEGLLFPSPRTGRAFLHTSASRALGSMAAAAGIKRPQEVTCHAARRSFADCAYQAGGSIEEIALTLGNTPEVVIKHYLSRSVSPAARRMNDLMNPEPEH